MSRTRRSPSDRKRKARRALRKALDSSARIQGASRQRQRSRLAGEANRAVSLDTDLGLLHSELSERKREAMATGLVPNGTPFKGRTWRAQ